LKELFRIAIPITHIRITLDITKDFLDNLVNSKAITYKTLISVLYGFTKNCVTRQWRYQDSRTLNNK